MNSWIPGLVMLAAICFFPSWAVGGAALGVIVAIVVVDRIEKRRAARRAAIESGRGIMKAIARRGEHLRRVK